MARLIDLSSKEARSHLLKGSSYLSMDLPPYISFQPILEDVAAVLEEQKQTDFMANSRSAAEHRDVNYNFIANKDGRFSWRPFELMHPAIYVSLVNLICESTNWTNIPEKLRGAPEGVVECCSHLMVSQDEQRDVGAGQRGHP